MTDPIYGSSPVDAGERWDDTLRPCLRNDLEMQGWRTLIADAMDELAASQWAIHWRTKSPLTAQGIHLDARGLDLGILRPDGWDDERYQPVVAAVDGAVFSNRPSSVTATFASALVSGAQTWEMSTPAPLTYVVYFYGVTADEVQTYFTVLERGRPRGVRMILVYSPEPKDGVFVLDESELDGPDILALSLFSPP